MLFGRLSDTIMGQTWTKYQLRKKNSDNTPEYGFTNQTLIGKIVSVYDGDTCTAIVLINGAFQKIKIRCNGYNSPEMKPPKTDPNRDAQIAHAKEAKTALEQLVLDKIVTLQVHGFDKYGRFLATIFVNVRKCFFSKKVNVNATMISNGYGVFYEGGTKPIIAYYPIDPNKGRAVL
jgi:endonuclease YncB( thermonuclease family)